MSRPHIGRRKLADVIDEFLLLHAAGEMTPNESRHAASCLSQARERVGTDPGSATLKIKDAKRIMDEAQARSERRKVIQ